MSNLISISVVHASTRDGEKVRICRRNANTMCDHQVSDRSVTCGNCLRMIAKVHAEALELHKAFLLGVAQAEVPAELLGRPRGLDALTDTELLNEILWARSELALFADAGHLTAYARRLTSLKLEREYRRVESDAELCRRDDHYDHFGEANENVANHVAAHVESAQGTRVVDPTEAEHQARKINPRGLVTEIGLGSDLQLHSRTVER